MLPWECEPSAMNRRGGTDCPFEDVDLERKIPSGEGERAFSVEGLTPESMGHFSFSGTVEV